MFYNITPSLKLTATFNTDFGETEVDARQINLSRFSVLFPEKRSFFLQGAGVFGFASTGPEPAGGIPPAGADVYPFFSRQIGLLGGEEVPIDAGIKLTGTVGRTDVGLLGVRTGDLRTSAMRSSAKRTSWSAGSSGTCSSSRTSAPSSRTAIRRKGSRARPTAPTCAWPHHASWAGRTIWW